MINYSKPDKYILQNNIFQIISHHKTKTYWPNWIKWGSFSWILNSLWQKVLKLESIDNLELFSLLLIIPTFYCIIKKYSYIDYAKIEVDFIEFNIYHSQ